MFSTNKNRQAVKQQSINSRFDDNQQGFWRLPKMQLNPNELIACQNECAGDENHAFNEQTLHQLFEQQVHNQPDFVAVICDDKQLSYQQLNRRANQLAHELLYHGVEPHQAVAICFERSLDMVVAMLAILKVGGVYVTIKPSTSTGRMNDVLHQSKAKWLLTHSELQSKSQHLPCKRLIVDKCRAKLALSSDKNPQLRGAVKSNDLCCIKFSSDIIDASMVKIAHQGIVNLGGYLHSSLAKIDFSGNDIWGGHASYAFDASVQVLSQLSQGLTCHLIDNLDAPQLI